MSDPNLSGRPVGPATVPIDGHVMTPVDARELLQTLERGDRFRCDTRLGRARHRGQISFRDESATHSLHGVIDGNHGSAHFDWICSLDLVPESSAHYSWAGVVATTCDAPLSQSS